MCYRKKLIKLLDERAAVALSDCGFSYIKEKINGDQTVYIFEDTLEFMNALNALCTETDFQKMIFIEDSLLNF